MEEVISEETWLEEEDFSLPEKKASADDFQSEDSEESEDKPPPKASSKPMIRYSFEPVKELFEDYIGIVIVAYTTYDENILDIEKRVILKLIAEVLFESNSIVLKLNTITGEYGGYIKITPGINGQFAEIKTTEHPAEETQYRFSFFGGDSLEYVDKKGEGKIYYSSSQYIKS